MIAPCGRAGSPQLGLPLFERTGRGVTPTAAALGIAEAARAMDDGAGLLTGHWRQQQTTQGTVRLSTNMVAAMAVAQALAEFQAQEPGIAIELVASMRSATCSGARPTSPCAWCGRPRAR